MNKTNQELRKSKNAASRITSTTKTSTQKKTQTSRKPQQGSSRTSYRTSQITSDEETKVRKNVTTNKKSPKANSKQKSPKKKKPTKFSEIERTGITQDLIGVKRVYNNGIIKTSSGRYVCIMEIFPLNFYQMTEEKQDMTVARFSSFFSICPLEGQFKTTMEKTDITAFISHLKSVCPDNSDPSRVAIRDAIIKNIYSIGSRQTIHYRYFFIFKYEGGMGDVRSSNIQDVMRGLLMERYNLAEIFRNCGNLVAEPENPKLATIDILYRHFNRNSSSLEPTLNRAIRVETDYRRMFMSNKNKFEYDYIDPQDYVAPRGLVFNDPEFIEQDGLYETYFSITDVGYPKKIPSDWITRIRDLAAGVLVDIDFDFHKVDKSLVKNILVRKNVWNRSTYSNAREEKKGVIKEKIDNSMYLISMIDAGEDVFDCLTVGRFIADDPKKLKTAMTAFSNSMKASGFHIEKSFLDTEEYYKLVRPLCSFDGSIFARNRRNMTTSSIAACYDMTGYSVSDPKGMVIGPDQSNGTIFAFDPFNTNMFHNGNMIFYGTPGSGKTFLELSLAARQLVNGNKVYMILPTKGFEYEKAVTAWGGEYVSLTPGTSTIINIMEIFPQIATTSEGMKSGASSLSKKVTSLVTWFRMLVLQEKNPNMYMSSMDVNKMDGVLKELYADFGITEDENSLWRDADHTKKRRMPIIQDWYDRLKGDPMLDQYRAVLDPFIYGSYKNFNGQTNIDITNSCIAFDIEHDNIGDTMHPVIMYIAYDLVTGLIKADKDHFGVCVIDEAWKLMIDETSAKQIEEEMRVIRGFGGGIVLATQSINEFLNSQYGNNILSCAEISIFLQMKETEFDKVKGLYDLTAADKKYLCRSILNSTSQGQAISASGKGQGLFYCNGNKVMFKLQASDYELALYTTDLNVKRRLAKAQKSPS